MYRIFLRLVTGIGIALIMFIHMAIAFNDCSDVITRDLDLEGIPGPYRFNSVCLTDNNELWSAAGGGEVHYYEVETGNSVIHKLENKSLFNGGFYGVFCGNKENIWVVGDNGVIFHTNDKGKNWELQKSGLKEDVNLNAITCSNAKCWTVGEYGTLLLNDNKGNIWKKLDIKAQEDLKDVFFINEQIGWIIGSEGGIWKTVDHGNSWSFQELMIDGRYVHSLDIDFFNEKKGWISGFDFVARTEDGGKTWQITELDGQIIGIVTQDGNKIWAIKSGGNYYSTDAGKTWTKCKREKS